MAVRPECFPHVRPEQGDALDGEKRHQTLCTKRQPHGNVHATEFKAPKQRDFQCVRLGPADAWVTLQATHPTSGKRILRVVLSVVRGLRCPTDLEESEASVKGLHHEGPDVTAVSPRTCRSCCAWAGQPEHLTAPTPVRPGWRAIGQVRRWPDRLTARADLRNPSSRSKR
jgi:hypothetical protein